MYSHHDRLVGDVDGNASCKYILLVQVFIISAFTDCQSCSPCACIGLFYHIINLVVQLSSVQLVPVMYTRHYKLRLRFFNGEVWEILYKSCTRV